MKARITKVMIIENDGRRVSLHPDKIVDDVEAYRKELKANFNAVVVLFNIEEMGKDEANRDEKFDLFILK